MKTFFLLLKDSKRVALLSITAANAGITLTAAQLVILIILVVK
jgi:hypothetical protein